jgi:DNA-binding transcriptional LysR family regulator
MEERLEAVALGHGLALVPATAAAYYQRPDITYRPVTGAQPYQVALATTTDTAQRAEARAFIKTALAIIAGNAAAPIPCRSDPPSAHTASAVL